MKRINKAVFFQSVIFLVALLIPLIASAGTCDKWVAKVVSVQGKVEAQKSG
jgi:hypothetical protein